MLAATSERGYIWDGKFHTLSIERDYNDVLNEIKRLIDWSLALLSLSKTQPCIS
jgi:hypothetical protein